MPHAATPRGRGLTRRRRVAVIGYGHGFISDRKFRCTADVICSWAALPTELQAARLGRARYSPRRRDKVNGKCVAWTPATPAGTAGPREVTAPFSGPMSLAGDRPGSEDGGGRCSQKRAVRAAGGLNIGRALSGLRYRRAGWCGPAVDRRRGCGERGRAAVAVGKDGQSVG